MSRYSGKCDLADTIDIHGERILNAKIYVGLSNKPLQINAMKDLIPYYPHIIGAACFDNVEGKSVIHLSSESWVDHEERESLEFKLKWLIKIYNRCKRKKIELNVDEAVAEIAWNGWNEEPCRELANRVKMYGKKATIEGIHLKMHEYYRQELVDEMLKNGLNPADYGYARFI
jgi:hypothetical protein